MEFIPQPQFHRCFLFPLSKHWMQKRVVLAFSFLEAAGVQNKQAVQPGRMLLAKTTWPPPQAHGGLGGMWL